MARFVLLFASLLFLVSASLPTVVNATQERGIVASASTITYFTSADEAQAHCPRDVVVWLNIPSGIYHYKGERWYGRTKHGAFVCEKEAIAAGDRASLNGQ
jgi:hypothetical protein